MAGWKKKAGAGARGEAPGGRTSTERGAKSGRGGADPGGNGGESGRGAPAAKKALPKLQTSRASDWPERGKAPGGARRGSMTKAHPAGQRGNEGQGRDRALKYKKGRRARKKQKSAGRRPALFALGLRLDWFTIAGIRANHTIRSGIAAGKQRRRYQSCHCH